MNLMRRKIKRTAIACLSLLMCASFTASCATVNLDPSGDKIDGSTETDGVSFTDVTDKYDTTALSIANFNSSVLKNDQPVYETRTVIVSLSGDCILDSKPQGVETNDYLATAAGQADLRNIDREQKTFLSKLNSHRIDYTLKASYSTVVNAVAIEIDTSNVKFIKGIGGVASASIAQTYLAPQTVESSGGSAVSNDANVHETGIYDTSEFSTESWGTGKGMLVAVLDTGLDYSHEAFAAFNDGTAGLRYSKEEIAELVATTEAQKRIVALGGTLTVEDVYVSNKVPFAFDYADNDADVYPSYSNHGTHVAGIVAGRAGSYVDKNGNVPVDDEGQPIPFVGVAPDAQLMICKTFTDNLDDPALGGAEAENIMSALEDCVNMGVDVINMSLGTTAGFTTTDDGDDEGETFDKIFKSIQREGISLVCAASNDYSAGNGSQYGTNLASNPDSGTVGSPSTYFAALSVASVSGQKTQYLVSENNDPVFFENASNGSGTNYDFVDSILPAGVNEKTFTYYDAGTGANSNYRNIRNLIAQSKEPVLVLVKRGGNTFQEKVEIAKTNGAKGIIVWNNVSGTIRMSLGDLDSETRIPAVSINNDSGELLVKIAEANDRRTPNGKITVSRSNEAGPFMSDFSSWGTTSDLKIKPEITAHGGEITSTVPGGYAEQSGTSMAAPNMSGLMAIIRSYVNSNTDLADIASSADSNVVQLANQLVMSTASIARDQRDLPYSPRKQGAGLANLGNIVETKAYLYTDSKTSHYYEGRDGRPKIELGDDAAKKGEYTFNFKVKNFGGSALNFTLKSQFMTETLSTISAKSVKEQAYMLEDEKPAFTFKGNTVASDGKISVAAGEIAVIGVTLKLSAAEKKYIDESFENGMFVEGFITLAGEGSQCDLNIPFLGFYGDWKAAPMLDYTAYEIADIKQDTSIKDEEKPSETVWATQPYASYNGDNYVIPMGGYVYTLDSSDTPMYANMEYNAISRFDERLNEEGIGNYVTSYEIRCVYAGLLRNAQQVNYKLYDAYTGELLTTGEKYRISKAYANGGSARPAYVELKLKPEELGLVSNGKYTFEFEFLFDKNDVLTEEQKAGSTFTFDFYVDYEAPVLRDARVRYQNYKENNKEKQRIYLDLDVFDNHYTQSVMLLYLDTEGERQELKLLNDYVTPVRNPNKNGVSTVSIEVTDVWEMYKDVLAVQIDDYALNHTSYILSNLSSSSSIDEEFSKDALPQTFDLAEGEENITLDINEMHKVSLVYEGNANLSNFGWTTASSRYIAVKNGEIVGVASTNGKSYPVFVTNYKGVTKKINVTVTGEKANIRGVSFEFGTIKNYNEALVAAKGTVSVYAGEEFTLEVLPYPWYFPMDGVTVEWKSSNENVVTVGQNGKVHTLKRGSATVTATVTSGNTTYSPVNVFLSVRNEFTVNGMTLTRYRGEGEDHINPVTGKIEHNVVIVPSEIAVMTIGEEAFKDNTVITKIIVPKTVTHIEKRAFQGCTALKEVCFQTDEEYVQGKTVSDSDLSIIDRNAFEGCTNLEKLDLRYTKVFTVGREAFKDCVNLKTVLKPTAIGTAYDRAFMGCTGLTSFDLSGLHVAGANVFSGCKNLQTVEFGEFSAIGKGMFAALEYEYTAYNYETNEWENHKADYSACTKIGNVQIKSSLVGAGAFEGCVGITSLTFDGASDIRIREGAFRDCTNLATVQYTNGATLHSVGDESFAGTAWSGSTSDAVTSGDTILLYKGSAAVYTLPVGVTKIAPYAFANTDVTEITNLNQVTEIGEGAFKNSRLERATFNPALTEIAPYAFYGTNFNTVQLPASVKFIGDYAFANCAGLTGFVYSPDSEAKFGNGVFSGCTALVQIELAPNITEMGDLTFFGCVKLKKVTLPALKSLGNMTFFNTPSLEEAYFNENAQTTGTNTFAAFAAYGSDLYPAVRTQLKTVKFGKVKSYKDASDRVVSVEIGEGVLLNCTGITQIDLNGITLVGDSAFRGCTSLMNVIGLDKVTVIGNYAFANTRLSGLNLSNAKSVGAYAFMTERGIAYKTITIPVAETVGDYAFYGNNVTEMEIPATLKSIGASAFANSPSLKNFKVAEGNEIFFADNGVLYRNLGETAYYGLVAFPSAKTVAEYAVKENTARIDAGAFFGHKATINKVILPYSVKSIGAMAFFDSGISVYEFKGVTAPALEAEYSDLVAAYAEANNVNFKGNYYANFENYYIFYNNSEYGVNVPTLTILYPSNGTGYDTPVYSLYFANRTQTDIAMSEAVNSFITNVSGFDEASEILTWNTSNKTKKEVEEFANLVKRTHEYYVSFRSDANQLAFVDSALIEKFNAIEAAMRQVKPVFGISVSILRLETSGDVRTEYRVGERFDMSGLQIIIVYDDYSTENADMSKVTLVSPTGPLTELDTTVTFSVEGISRTASLRIYVTENGPSDGGNCAGIAGGDISSFGGPMLLMLVIAGGLIVISTYTRKKLGERK